ncbi:hypothetical protein AAG906_022512 [Vitis piasezkii]
MEDGGSTFEEIIDAYLSYLQITVVDPAMDKALKLLEKFVYVLVYVLVPWRHPPQVRAAKKAFRERGISSILKEKAVSMEEAQILGSDGRVEVSEGDIFISRETFGWTPQEAKLHMVTDYFSHSELAVIADVLGPNPPHLFELYALKQSNYYQKVMEDSGSTFEDIIDAYLQITVVNPAMDEALKLLEKFAVDARSGRIQKIDYVLVLLETSSRIDNPTLC